jgi:hypothetical protein
MVSKRERSTPFGMTSTWAISLIARRISWDFTMTASARRAARRETLTSQRLFGVMRPWASGRPSRSSPQNDTTSGTSRTPTAAAPESP